MSKWVEDQLRKAVEEQFGGNRRVPQVEWTGGNLVRMRTRGTNVSTFSADEADELAARLHEEAAKARRGKRVPADDCPICQAKSGA